MAKKAPSAISLALCLMAAQAAADEPASPSPPPTPPPAESAQPSNAERADALFKKGKELFEAGKFVEACGAFAESDALDPTVSTLGLLASCHEQQGKLVTAWNEYRETERRASATGDSRGAFARDRAAALEPRLPRLTISIAKPTPGIEILRNEDKVPAEELGIAVPMEVGTWEIVARAPGRHEFHMTVTTKERERAAVVVPELEAIKPVFATPRETPKLVPPPEAGNARTNAALVAGGLGLTGLGVGIALGVSASKQNAASQAFFSFCQKTGQGCAEGRVMRDSAFSTAAGSTIGFAVGVAGVGIGAVLLLLPSRKPSPAAPEKPDVQVTPLVSSQGGGAAFAGRF